MICHLFPNNFLACIRWPKTHVSCEFSQNRLSCVDVKVPRTLFFNKIKTNKQNEQVND